MKKHYLLLSFLVILASCGSSKTSETQEAETETQEVADGEREPTDDEIREYGLITEIGDTGYPRFYIDVEFPERNMRASFSFNVEESPLNMEQLTAMEGKYATIYYVIEDDPRIEAIVRECEPVFGEISPESNGGKEITGVLTGATSLSGDLPGTITVTASDGSSIEFEVFIEDDIMAVNDEEVTVFYYENSASKITYLKASED